MVVEEGGLITLRLYSRIVQCEIRKNEVYDIDFSRPSPENKSGRGIHSTYRATGVGAILCRHFEKSRFYSTAQKSEMNRQSADIARKRRSTARLQTDARHSRNGSERFGSGTQAYGQI